MAGRDAPIAAGESASLRLYRTLLGLYPTDFRVRYGDEMVQLFSDQLRDARASEAGLGQTRAWFRILADLASSAAAARTRRDRFVAHSLAEPPSVLARLLGLVGILGGLMLIVAFVPNVAWSADFFNLRLVLFNTGAVAVVIAVHRRQAAASPKLALTGAVPAILANALYLVMVVRLVAQPGEPGPGDYGPWFDVAATFLWLADAWFGLVVLRIGVMPVWIGLMLAIGSTLSWGGMARLGLVSGDFAAIFAPLSQVGIAMNGLAWIALGLVVATRRRVRSA